MERFVEVVTDGGAGFRLHYVHLDSPFLREGDRVALESDGTARLARKDDFPGMVIGECSGFIADVTLDQATAWFEQRYRDRFGDPEPIRIHLV